MDKMKQYVRITHKGRGYNVRVELPDGSTQLVPLVELEQWECLCTDVSKLKDTYEEPKTKPTYKRRKAKQLVNGLDLVHPYEGINMTVESVEFCDGVQAPF